MSDPFDKLRLAPAEEGATRSVTVRHNKSDETHAARSDNPFVLPPASASDATASPTAAVTPLGAMLARHVLRDGEIVLLALKPSFWFILLSSLRFLAVVAIVTLGAIAYEGRHNREWFYIEAGIFMAAGRIMWAVLQWMGRLYILTDLRVIRLSGVFKLDIFDCALRKIARTAVTQSARERCSRTGTIEIMPADEECPAGQWQTIRRPHQVNDVIVNTINRAKQHGHVAAA